MTPERALQRLADLCAKREYCTSDAVRLMTRWGIDAMTRTAIVEKLYKAHFIDDVRYCEAFVREKTRLSEWGSYKIRMALARKHISKEIIDTAMSENFVENTSARLETMLRRKMRNTRYKDAYDLKTKLLRYGASAGYGFDEVRECADKLVKCNEED